jgi:hypothetical protein
MFHPKNNSHTCDTHDTYVTDIGHVRMDEILRFNDTQTPSQVGNYKVHLYLHKLTLKPVANPTIFEFTATTPAL